MIDIPMKCKSAVNRTTLHTLNKKQNERQPQTEESTVISSVLKEQKISLGSSLTGITARLGWKTKNTRCDINVSAFLLGADGKVPGDDWFVFYGQTHSPDQSTVFCAGQAEGSESVTVDFRRLHPSVKKIVFVLTIYEALEHKLHFGMVSDAWIRILNSNDNTELVLSLIHI